MASSLVELGAPQPDPSIPSLISAPELIEVREVTLQWRETWSMETTLVIRQTNTKKKWER